MAMTSYGALPLAGRVPLGRRARRLLPAAVAGGVAVAAVVAVVLVAGAGGRGALLSMPMSKMMQDIHSVPDSRLEGSGLKSTAFAGRDGGAVISTLRQLDQPQVEDTTGRTLTDEAIKASGLSDRGKLSNNDLAVLETAGTLTPQLAQRRGRGQLPAYVQVAQDRAMNDGQDSGEYMDAIPGNIVTVREEGGVDPKLAARKAKQVLDTLNRGYAKSMQKWLTGSDKVGDVVSAIDSRSASFLANTGDMGKPIAPETEKAILDTADKQHYHEKAGLVKSEESKGEIPQEVRDSINRLRQAGESVANLNALLQAEKAVPKDETAATTEGVVHTEDGFVLRIDPRAAGKFSPMRPVAGKAQLAMLADLPPPDPREKEIDGCLCSGSSDEDKGPKCSCIGDPEFANPTDVFSPSEVTRWADEAHQAMRANVQSLRAEDKEVRGPNSVEATADGINSYLQAVVLRAQERKVILRNNTQTHARARAHTHTYAYMYMFLHILFFVFISY
jgi:hypothetical protein